MQQNSYSGELPHVTNILLAASWIFTAMQPRDIPIILSSISSVVAMLINLHKWYMEYKKKRSYKTKKNKTT